MNGLLQKCLKMVFRRGGWKIQRVYLKRNVDLKDTAWYSRCVEADL